MSASVHGTAGDPRYAAVFAENPEGVRWGYSKGDSESEYQRKFSAVMRFGFKALRSRNRFVSANLRVILLKKTFFKS